MAAEIPKEKGTTVLPPYRYQYSYDHFDRLGDAHEHYSDLERGEYEGWLPHAILPAVNGVPMGAKKVL